MSGLPVYDSKSSSNRSVGLEQVEVQIIRSIDIKKGTDSLVSRQSERVPKKVNRDSMMTNAVSLTEPSQWEHFTQNIKEFV